MGKTLYLSESQSLVFVKRDGPSIWITRKDKAGQRIPVRLVGRVVVIGNVVFDAGSITLFSENDIPVIFMSRTADEIAVTMPFNHRIPLYYKELKSFQADDTRWRSYMNWAKTWRFAVQSKVLKRLYPQLGHELPFKIGEKDFKEVIDYLKPHDELKWNIVRSFINNLFRTIIIEQLFKNELDPHLGIIHRGYAFGLVLDICYMIAAERDMQCLQFFRSTVENPASDRNYRICNVTDSVIRNIVHRFENRRGAISKMVIAIIDELLEMIKGVKNEGTISCVL